MNEPRQSPWPSIIKIALLIGCTMGFCILGLISGVLAAKVMQQAANAGSDALLFTVLIPPVVGALFGFFVGLVSTLFVRWVPQKPFVGSQQTFASSNAAPPPGQGS